MDVAIMNGLTELLDGVEITVTIGGEPYSFSELPIGSLKLLQDWVNKNIPHPLDALKGHLDGLPEAVAVALADKARQEMRNWPIHVGTAAGAAALTGSESGQKEVLFLGIKQHRPDITREQSDRVYRRMNLGKEQVAKRIFSVLFGWGDPEREADDPIPKASENGSRQLEPSRSTGA